MSVSRKSDLIAKARELFFRQGYENVSVQQLIDAVGVAKGTFYHHFESKDELLADIVESISQEIHSQFLPIAGDESQDAIEKLNEIFRLSNSWKNENHDEVLAVYRMLRNPQNLHLRLRLQERQLELLEGLFGQIVSEGAARGALRCSHPEESAQAVASILYGLSERIVDLIEEASTRDVFARNLASLLLGTANVLERILGVSPGRVELAKIDELIHWYDDLSAAAG